MRGRRSEPRATVALKGSAEAIRGCSSASILDVSRTGARIQGPDLPDVGKDVVLRCGGLETFGKVSWAASGRCGIEFYEPIAVRHLMALRKLSDAIEDSSMTPDEVQAAADWASGFAR